MNKKYKKKQSIIVIRAILVILILLFIQIAISLLNNTQDYSSPINKFRDIVVGGSPEMAFIVLFFNSILLALSITLLIFIGN